MLRAVPGVLRLAAALSVALLGLLASLVVLDVIPRDLLTTFSVKILLLFGIFAVVTLVVTLLVRPREEK